ncbi:MAG: RNA polymerase sigma factor RpoD/SigA [Candidatus Andersenbacteria bacterium]
MAEHRSKKSGSILSQYLREIGETPLLNAEGERVLAERIQRNGDEAARQQMMRANLRLVVNIAKKYAPANDPDMLMDLIQEGNLGLMRAVDRFKPERKTRFSTYGVYWIKQAILRALKSRRLVRLPENVVDRVLEMQRTRQRLYQFLGRVPTSQEVADEMHLKITEINRLEEASAEIVSLDRTVRGGEDSEETQLQDLLEDVEAPQPDQVALSQIIRQEITQAVSTLPAREKKIVELRFGLGDDEPHTLEDIGQEFGISRERVRQLQNSALHRLRHRQNVVKAHL